MVQVNTSNVAMPEYVFCNLAITSHVVMCPCWQFVMHRGGDVSQLVCHGSASLVISLFFQALIDMIMIISYSMRKIERYMARPNHA